MSDTNQGDDRSMSEILSSIRRIVTDEETSRREADEERRQRKTISLNLEERQADRDYWDDLYEQLLNDWKIAKGIPMEEPEEETVAENSSVEGDSDSEVSLASEEESDDANTDDVASTDEEDEANEPDPSESLLNETANIFADLLDLLYGNQSLANRQNI